MLDLKRFKNPIAFLDWLNSLPDSTAFHYSSCNSCLIATWAKECGEPTPAVGPRDMNWTTQWGDRKVLEFEEDAPYLNVVDDVVGGQPQNLFLVEHVRTAIKLALEGDSDA